MADLYRKVQSGDQMWGFPAPVYNGLIDLLAEAKTNSHTGVAHTLQRVRQSGLVRVCNRSGYDRYLGDVLAISGPAQNPSTNTPSSMSPNDQAIFYELLYHPVLEGRMPNSVHPPDTSSDIGNLVVLAESIPRNMVGLAVMSGFAMACIRLERVEDTYADVRPGYFSESSEDAVQHACRAGSDCWGSIKIIKTQTIQQKELPTFVWALVKVGDGQWLRKFELYDDKEESAEPVIVRPWRWRPGVDSSGTTEDGTGYGTDMEEGHRFRLFDPEGIFSGAKRDESDPEDITPGARGTCVWWNGGWYYLQQQCPK